MEKEKTEKPGIVAQIVALEFEAGGRFEIPSQGIIISKNGIEEIPLKKETKNE